MTTENGISFEFEGQKFNFNLFGDLIFIMLWQQFVLRKLMELVWNL